VDLSHHRTYGSVYGGLILFYICTLLYCSIQVSKPNLDSRSFVIVVVRTHEYAILIAPLLVWLFLYASYLFIPNLIKFFRRFLAVFHFFHMHILSRTLVCESILVS